MAAVCQNVLERLSVQTVSSVSCMLVTIYLSGGFYRYSVHKPHTVTELSRRRRSKSMMRYYSRTLLVAAIKTS